MSGTEQSKRSRRLRKKLYVGEFAVYGFDLTLELDDAANPDFESFFYRLADLVESRGLMIAGGGGQKFEGFVCSGQRYGSASSEDQQAIEGWLKEQAGVSNVVIGPLVDAHNLVEI